VVLCRATRRTVQEEVMRKSIWGLVLATGLAMGATGASAQMAASGSMASHSAMSAMAPHGPMASSAGHTKETKMDVMMVNNCLKMSHDKMRKDAECKDYMKHHPDWMHH
jgi:hypothetical protein